MTGEWDPPPDLDTGGSDDGGTGAPDVINDGEGRGVLVGPRWGYRHSVIIGTPMKDQGSSAPILEAGEVGVLVNNGGIELPSPQPARIIEGSNHPACGQDHEFTYDLQADRWFGSAFSFYSGEIGADLVDYRTVLVTSAPIGGAESGRVMQFHENPCLSCVMFPRSPQNTSPLGNETGTRFGTTVGVGFFEGFSPDAWPQQAFESLAVGAPRYGNGGGVHIYGPVAYKQWRWTVLHNAFDGDDQCDWVPGTQSVQWRLRTIGSQQVDEQFGAAMAVADFNCDGYDDLAVGAPAYDVPGEPSIEDAGALRIYYGGNDGIGLSGSDQFLQGDFTVGGEPEEGDRFASVLAVGNFNGRRVDTDAAWSCWDLAVGTPDEDDGAGEVQVFYGSPSGLVPGPILRLGENDLPGTRDAGDRFGQAIVAAVFDDLITPSGFHDLAIGAPGDEDGGSVVVIPASGQGQGLMLDQATQLIQGDGIVDTNEAGDEFGAALSRIRVGTPSSILSTPALVVGAPGEDSDQGAVFVVVLQEDDGLLVPMSSEVWRQADMNANAQSGDRFGSVLAQERAFPRRPWAVASYSWACEVDELVVTETSCDTTPVSASCPSGQEAQNPVSPPHVSIGSGWDGWIVHMDDVDPVNPTQADLAVIEDACVAACALEYAHDPHVAATCSSTGAFVTPYPVAGEHRGASAVIPAEYQDGSGLWGTEELDCSLHDDCCSAFDEAVCPAQPDRVTTAQSQLGRGEEYVVTISGSLTAMSVDDENEESASITGSIGFSQCRDGNENGPCPLYVGAAHIELIQSLVLEIDCDGEPYELTLDALEIDLLQPAMGIDFEDNAWASFPPGALFMETYVALNDGLFVEKQVGHNEDPVYLQFEPGWLSAQGAGGFKILFPIACNGQIEPMTAWLSFSAIAATAQPPTIAIDMPSTVTCGAVVGLDASTADPDGDHSPPRWIVDGVLLAPDIEEIEVNETHEIVAVIRDTRGATTTDVHMISCSPP